VSEARAAAGPRPPSAVAAALLVARRELGGYLRAPIAYVVGVLFLAVQGAAFAALVSALSDPARPGPLGAVLEGYFGGTLLHWALELAVVALIAMRAVAEDKRAGTWEALVTAPVGEGAALVGKWLAAAAFYALLWLPTLAYLVVLAIYRPAGAAIDPGPIAAAYAGEWLVGAALLAIGVAASAATASQILAGAASFGAGMALLLAGEAVAGAAGWSAAHPDLAAVARALSPRAQLAGFARGEVTVTALVFCAGLAAVGLSAAIALAGRGRRRRGETGTRALATVLIALVAIEVGVIAARHPWSWDVTRGGANSLEPGTREVLARVAGPTEAWVVEPSMAGIGPVFDRVDRVLARMARAQPLIRVRRFDPALTEGGLAAIARDAGLGEAALSRGGAVVLVRGGRRRVVDLLELASFGRDALAAPAVTRLGAEAALARALVGLDDDHPIAVCATSGHGELPLGPGAGPTWDGVARRLIADGARLDDVGVVAAGVPARCQVLVVAGPTRALADAEVLAIRDYVAGGGALVVAASAAGADLRAPATGLEPLCATWGLDLSRAIASDPSAALDLPGAFAVPGPSAGAGDDGYADDPLTAGFAGGRRVTIWIRPRVVGVRPVAGVHATALVSTTAAGRGDDPGGGRLAGPVAIAAVARKGGGAVLVVGSAESASSAVAGRGLGAADLLVARAIERLAGRVHMIDVAERAPEQVRLVMTSGQRTMVVALCAGAIPLAYAALGLLVVLLRRRRT
jgi:ABC-type uncharacterized transport system/ABC-2 family transporter protein